MPTVLRFDGMRAVVYPNDHRPAHVHIIGGDGEAVFDLNCPDGPPVLRECYGFTRRDAGRIAASLAEHLAELCMKWRAIHGRY